MMSTTRPAETPELTEPFHSERDTPISGSALNAPDGQRGGDRSFAAVLLARFARVTSGGQLVPQLDGLRFFAILFVVLYHLNGFFTAFTPVPKTFRGNLLWSTLDQGGIGVELFFTISGFILALPFAASFLNKKPLPSLRKYFIRRVTRLEPPYMIAMACAFVATIVVVGMPFHKALPHLAAGMVYLHNLVYSTSNPINCVTWSLEIEVQFYVLAPLFCRVFAIRSVWWRRGVLVVLALASIGATHLACSLGFPVLRKTLLGFLPFFLGGFFLVDLYLSEWKDRPRQNPAWDLGTTAAFVLLFVSSALHWAPEFLRPVLIFVAYVGAFRGVIWSRITSNRWLVTIGGMCYTIYLYHYILISAIGHRTIGLTLTSSYHLNILVQFVLICLPILLISGLLFLLFEKPFMYRDWPQKLLSRVPGFR